MRDAAFRWEPLESPWSRVTIRGLPGYGKSWLVRHHASSLASSALQRLDEDTPVGTLRLPVLLRCAQLGERLPERPGLADTIAAIAGVVAASHPVAGDLNEVLADAHQRERLTICLDGLDEVPASDFEKIRAAIGALTRGRNQILVSTRPLTQALSSVVDAPGTVTFELLGFSPQQATDVARFWFTDDEEKLDAFRKVLRAPASAPLLQVPLLTSYLCSVVADLRPGEPLPTSRTALYRALLARMLSGGLASSRARTFVDPHSPPDPSARMRVLGVAVSELFSAWRSGHERMDRAALRQAYEAASPADLETVRSGALRRWRAWAGMETRQTIEPPADLITWELIWDGLLVDEAEGGVSAQVRFAHPTLREFVVAAHVCELPRDEQAAVIEEHRWFDRGWQQILPVAMALSADPEQPLTVISESTEDPWYEQRLLAGRCLAACEPERVAVDLRAAIVAGVGEAVLSSSIFDRDRGLATLTALVAGEVPEARQLALDLSNSDELRQSARCRLACSDRSTGRCMRRQCLPA